MNENSDLAIKQEPVPVDTASRQQHVVPFGSRSFHAVEQQRVASQLLEDTSPAELKSRPGPAGRRLTYIEGWRAIDIANRIFGFNGWSSELRALRINFCKQGQDSKRWGACVSCTVRITLKDGTFHEDRGNGSSENQRGEADAVMLAEKEAVTDANKRALKNFGRRLGLSLYSNEHLRNLGSTGTKAKTAPAVASSARTAGNGLSVNAKSLATSHGVGRTGGKHQPQMNPPQQRQQMADITNAKQVHSLPQRSHPQVPHASRAVVQGGDQKPNELRQKETRRSFATASEAPHNAVGPVVSHPVSRVAHPCDPAGEKELVRGALVETALRKERNEWPERPLGANVVPDGSRKPASVQKLGQFHAPSDPPEPENTAAFREAQNKHDLRHQGEQDTRGPQYPGIDAKCARQGRGEQVVQNQRHAQVPSDPSACFAPASSFAKTAPTMPEQTARVKPEDVLQQREARLEKIRLLKLQAKRANAVPVTPAARGGIQRDGQISKEAVKVGMSPVTPGVVVEDRPGVHPRSNAPIWNTPGGDLPAATHVNLDERFRVGQKRPPSIPEMQTGGAKLARHGVYGEQLGTGSVVQQVATSVARVTPDDVDDLMESYIGDS